MLDAGCGAGTISRSIARAVPRGDVVGLDREPRYLDFARRQAAAEGLSNLRFETGDLLNLPFEDHCFDLAWSNWGIEAEASSQATRGVSRRSLRGWERQPGAVVRTGKKRSELKSGPAFRATRSGALQAWAEITMHLQHRRTQPTAS